MAMGETARAHANPFTVAWLARYPFQAVSMFPRRSLLLSKKLNTFDSAHVKGALFSANFVKNSHVEEP